MTRIYFILLFFVTYNYGSLFAQQLHSSSKKAEAYHKKALQYYRESKLDESINFTKKALNKDSCFIESLILCSQIYEEQNEPQKSINYYSKAIKCGSSLYPQLYIFRANLFYSIGNYTQAYNDFKTYKNLCTDSTEIKQLNVKLNQLQLVISLVNNKHQIYPKRLSDSINTSDDEYAAQINFDFDEILFTRAKNVGQMPQEAIFVAKKQDNSWQKAINAKFVFNTTGNEGSTSLSTDMRHLVFAACNRPDGLGRCDIYISEYNGKNWLPPKNIGAPINTKFWESQPSLSADGNTLYFVSNRPGGIGKADIWYSQKDESGKWKTPINMGTEINSEQNESYPFIHANNKTLFFGSQGHVNLGGFDLFYSNKDSLNKWTEAINIGFPINSSANESGIFVHPDGKTALISKSESNENKNLDIYQFELDSSLSTKAVYKFMGTVLDKITNHPIKAQIIIENSNDDIFVTESYPTNGQFSTIFQKSSALNIYIYAKNYVFYTTEIVNPKNKQNQTFYLSKIQNQSKTTFHFNFAFNSTNLNTNSQTTVKHLAEYLKINPNLKINIIGYTDSIGNTTYNQNLSLGRAKAVYDLLKLSGISIERMKYEGKGSLNPVENNKTEINRAKNRRTEITYITN